MSINKFLILTYYSLSISYRIEKMANSRLEKYKEYRDSSIKEETPNMDLSKATEEVLNPSKSSMRNTSTLPMDEVMKKIDQNSKDVVFLRKQRNKHILKVLFCILGTIVTIAAIVIIGILLWRN